MIIQQAFFFFFLDIYSIPEKGFIGNFLTENIKFKAQEEDSVGNKEKQKQSQE